MAASQAREAARNRGEPHMHVSLSTTELPSTGNIARNLRHAILPEVAIEHRMSCHNATLAASGKPTGIQTTACGSSLKDVSRPTSVQGSSGSPPVLLFDCSALSHPP